MGEEGKRVDGAVSANQGRRKLCGRVEETSGAAASQS
jgi:hypothetical protein